ncbi:MAG: YegS/Rv2252/BmrU family lipid kinase [Chitinophagaceae bacterium]|nr:YegS/Rv2252/BmrU family lipid kinase [Chitinophagaceae bacterium]
MKKILYLLNPLSGTKSPKKIIQAIQQETTKRNIPFHIQNIHTIHNYKDIIKNADITHIIIIGGDGTISTVLNELIHSSIIFGIIPTGSGNGFAFSLGISHKLKKYFDTLFEGNITQIDLFSVNNQYACSLFGLGFDAQVAHQFATQKKRGLISYISLSLKNLIPLKSYSFHIKTENVQFDIHAYMVVVTNSNQFGNNVKIAPLAKQNDGLLDVVILPKINFLTLLLQYIQLLHTKKMTNLKNIKTNKIIYFQTNNITITNIDKAPTQKDGDIYITEQTIHINIIPHACKFLTTIKT